MNELKEIINFNLYIFCFMLGKEIMFDFVFSILNLGLEGSGSANGSSPLLLLLLLVIPIGLFFYFMKKKKNKDSTKGPTTRHEGDEVWKTVKDFLKSSGDVGKEVIETYVAKRPDENIINRNLSKEEQKKQKEEIKKRKEELKLENKRLKEEGKLPKSIKPRELYVVLFTTRNPKNKKTDSPRAIECEVKMIKKNKYDTERKIVILGERNYKKESEWILPIKEAEEARFRKEIERKEKKLKRKKIKEEKKKNKKK